MWSLTNILLGVLILQIACYACMYVVWRYQHDKKISRMVDFLHAINENIDTLIIITRKEHEKK